MGAPAHVRLLHVLLGRCDPNGASGVDTAVYHLSRAQAALGHPVAVFCITDDPPAPVEGVAVRSYPPERFPFRVPRALLRDLHEWRPDVVHLHSAYVPANVTIARHLRRVRIPYVVTPHGGLAPQVMRRRPYLKWPYKVIFERPLLNRAACVHAVSDVQAIRRYGVRAPVVVAPNGMDADSIPREVVRGLLVRRWPAVRGRRVFLFLGRLDPLVKGLDLLLEAFQRAARSRPDIALVLVGPDHRGGEQRLRRLARRLALESRVAFYGPAYGCEKYGLLHDADVFVHTSRTEAGLPFAVMEALACGRPCLLTRAADPLGLVAAYHGGTVVEPTVEAIAAAIVWFSQLGEEALRERGARVRQLVRRELGWQERARALEAAYVRGA